MGGQTTTTTAESVVRVVVLKSNFITSESAQIAGGGTFIVIRGLMGIFIFQAGL